MITYRVGNDLDTDQVIELYDRSTLGLRRPSGDAERMDKMIREANLVVTAWMDDRLVGIARCLTDFSYVTYLADLAVDERFQRQGIGRGLIHAVRDAHGAKTKIVLLAAPDADSYYGHIGFKRHNRAWVLDEGDAVL